MKTEEIEIEGQKILIPGADLMDKSELAEIKAWQTERASKPHKKKRGGIAPIDAYRELSERKAYNKRKEETGHGRFF